MSYNYTEEQIIELAKLAAADYAAACKGPTIRGLNGEEKFRGRSIEEVTAACERDNFLSAEEALAFGLVDRVLDHH